MLMQMCLSSICVGIGTCRGRAAAQLMSCISCYSDFCQEFPCSAFEDVMTGGLGVSAVTALISLLVFRAERFCWEVPLLSSSFCTKSICKDRPGGSILQEAALLQLASIQPQLSQSAEKKKHEHSPYRALTKALWGSWNRPCSVGISVWASITRFGVFYSRPAQSFAIKLAKTNEQGTYYYFYILWREIQQALVVHRNG